MLPQNKPDRIRILFDDHRLVANAGLLLPATLARHLGLRELVDHHLDLGGAPGRANTGDKMLTLVASRAGRRRLHRRRRCAARWWDGRCSRLRGQGAIHPGDLPAQLPVGACPSTRPREPPVVGPGLGRWGRTRRLAPDHRPGLDHLRDLWTGQGGSAPPRLYRRRYHPLLAIAAGTGEVLMSRLREGRANTARGAAHFLRETVGRVRYGGARGQLTVRANSGFYAHTVVAACREMDVRFSITIRQRASLRDLIEAIPEEDWTPIPYWTDGAADVAETTYTPFQTKPDAAPVRLIVRRVKPTPGSQLALFARYSYHAFITDRDGETLELEADHRRHAEVENAIRDLKYGVGLNHMPSARFAANGAWLAVQVMAHNLARWTARIGLGERTVITKTLRRRVFALVGRITRSARRLTLHLPRRWPWEISSVAPWPGCKPIPFPA